jgi:hypothetical protein
MSNRCLVRILNQIRVNIFEVPAPPLDPAGFQRLLYGHYFDKVEHERQPPAVPVAGGKGGPACSCAEQNYVWAFYSDLRDLFLDGPVSHGDPRNYG